MILGNNPITDRLNSDTNSTPSNANNSGKNDRIKETTFKKTKKKRKNRPFLEKLNGKLIIQQLLLVKV